MLPPRLSDEILRQVDRLELAMQQLAAVEAARDAALAAERVVDAPPASDEHGATLLQAEGPGARLLRLKGIGPETASVLAGEAFFRDFRNRREVASYAGLAPSPWQSGGVDHEQGISKAGNARVRKAMGRSLRRFRVRSTWKAGGGNWPGCGCATSLIPRSAPGIATEFATARAA